MSCVIGLVRAHVRIFKLFTRLCLRSCQSILMNPSMHLMIVLNAWGDPLEIKHFNILCYVICIPINPTISMATFFEWEILKKGKNDVSNM